MEYLSCGPTPLLARGICGRSYAYALVLDHVYMDPLLCQLDLDRVIVVGLGYASIATT